MAKKILLTGFEPFDKDEKNPSSDWISWMIAKPVPENSENFIRGIVLPVTFDGAFATFKKYYDEFCPDIVILTGFAKNRTELTIERIGINWIDARIPDNEGKQIKFSKIDSNGPDGLFTTLPIDKIIALCEKGGKPMKVSTSAGEYVCNDLLYKTLCYTLDKNTAVTFIHLPLEHDYAGIYLALQSIVYGLQTLED